MMAYPVMSINSTAILSVYTEAVLCCATPPNTVNCSIWSQHITYSALLQYYPTPHSFHYLISKFDSASFI